MRNDDISLWEFITDPKSWLIDMILNIGKNIAKDKQDDLIAKVESWELTSPDAVTAQLNIEGAREEDNKEATAEAKKKYDDAIAERITKLDKVINHPRLDADRKAEFIKQKEELLKDQIKVEAKATWVEIKKSEWVWNDKDGDGKTDVKAEEKKEEVKEVDWEDKKEIKEEKTEESKLDKISMELPAKLPEWVLPYKLFSDELNLRWTADSRNKMDWLIAEMWTKLEWKKWSAERNIWIANAMITMKNKYPDNFVQLKKQMWGNLKEEQNDPSAM